jgi:hypothetical protein
MVEPDFTEKIIFLSYGRSPSPSYHLYLAIMYIVIYKRLVLVFWSIEIDWGWFLSVLYKYELWCVSVPDTPPQRSIFTGFPWLAKTPKAFVLGVFEPSEHNGRARFPWKNHILELWWVPLPPLSAISCNYVNNNIQMAVPSVFWAYKSIGDGPRVSWACLKWNMSVFLIPPTKTDFYRLPMTCQDSKGIFPEGYWTFWTRWSSQISQKKSHSWVMQGPPPPSYPLCLTMSHFNPRPIL